MLALALLRIEIFFLLPSFSIETKSWQKHQILWDSNNLVDFNNVYKELIPRKSSLKNPLKKILTKNPKILKKIQENSKKFPPKNPEKIQTISKQFLKIPNFKKYPINSLHRTWRPKTLSDLLFFKNQQVLLWDWQFLMLMN